MTMIRSHLFQSIVRSFSTSAERNKGVKICIVGGGPAGYYAAQHIIKVRMLSLKLIVSSALLLAAPFHKIAHIKDLLAKNFVSATSYFNLQPKQ